MPARDKVRRAVKKTEKDIAKGGRAVENKLKKGGRALKKDARKARNKV